MERRDLLRMLISTTALSALPIELMAALQEVKEQTNSNHSLRTLNQHQNLTVTTIAELIIPETDTPGAKGARVNEFIDLLLTEWLDQSDTTQFLQGLAQIDADSRQRFGINFVACNPSQQSQLMKQFDDAAMEFTRSHRGAKTNLTAESGNFFYNLKRLTLLGYYTSEIGFEQELRKTIIPPKHAGCAPTAEKQQ
jgi:hypothetical protein